MEELKCRTEVILAVVEKRNTTLYPMTNIELVYLQFRKILELIALASLVANKTEYAKQRDKFYQDWHAERILRDIEKVNPDHYPVAGKQVIDPTTGKVIQVLPVKSGFLTKAEFVELYKACGSVLHAENPFSPRCNFNAFETRIPQWLKKITTLLNHHQIQLLDRDKQLWVVMHGKDGRVHGCLFQRMDVQPVSNCSKLKADQATRQTAR